MRDEICLEEDGWILLWINLHKKLNAQEMIKANSAADAEEMDQLKKPPAGIRRVPGTDAAGQ